MRLTVYQCKEDLSDDPNYVGTLAILKYCRIPHDVVVNVRETMVRAHGKVNPSCGFVVAVPEQLKPKYAITNCMQLASWINEYGFTPL